MALSEGVTRVLESRIGQNLGYEYILFLGVMAISFAALNIIKGLSLLRLRAIAEKTRSDFDDRVLEHFSSGKTPLYLAASAFIAITLVPLSGTINRLLFYTFVVVFTYYAAVAVKMLLIDYLVQKEIKRRKETRRDSISPIKALGAILSSGLWLMAILFILSNMGVRITSLIAGLGIGGIAIAFAMQRILEDIFASFSIYFDRPFEEGDYIVVGIDSGTVKKIGIKTTRIETIQGQELVMSNRELTTARIHNFRKMEGRNIIFQFIVPHDVDQKRLEAIPGMIRGIFKKVGTAALKRIHLKDIVRAGCLFEMEYSVGSPSYSDYLDSQEKINYMLRESLSKKGIGMVGT